MDNIIGKVIGIDKDADGDILYIQTTDDTSPINMTSNPWCEIIMYGDLVSLSQKALYHVFLRHALKEYKKIKPEENETSLDFYWKNRFGMTTEVSYEINEKIIKIPQAISLGDEATISTEKKKWNKHIFMDYFQNILQWSVEDADVKVDDFEEERLRRIKRKKGGVK